MSIFAWLESTMLALWVGESLWGYPICLAAHSVGLAMMVGIVTVADLRIIGCFSSLPLESFRKALKFAWCGFLINIVSGFSLYASQASYFSTHVAFLIKIAAILLAGVNAFMVQRMLTANASYWDAGDAIPNNVKVLAISSLLLWGVAVVAGRLIAYV